MEYKIKTVTKHTPYQDMFNYFLTFEDYPNQVSILAKKDPVEGETIAGTITESKVGDKTYYKFKKDKPAFGGGGGNYTPRDKASIVTSMVFSSVKKLVEHGIIPFFYHKAYSLNDVANDLSEAVISQKTDISVEDRIPYLSYAIDLVVAEKEGKITLSEKLSKLSDKVMINYGDGQVEVIKPIRVIAIYKGLIIGADAQYNKLKPIVNVAPKA